MNNAQRALLAVYLPITVLFLIVDRLYPAHALVNYVKYTSVISFFLVSLAIRKTRAEQGLISLALFFVVLADFFLVYCNTLPQLANKVVPLGIAGFMLAYLVLIIVYQKNFSLSKKEAFALLAVLSIFVPVFLILAPHVTGFLFIGASVFGFVLCYMTWTSICTIFRGYFNPGAARIIALSGILMFICDLGVANSLFNPAYSGSFVPWLKNIIWGAYIPAWCMQVMLIADENLVAPPYNARRYTSKR